MSTKAAGAADAWVGPRVVDQGRYRALQFNGLALQSQMDREHPDWLVVDYTRLMMAFLLFNARPSLIEMIGLGGGSLAKYCLRAIPGARLRVFEIDPKVIALREAFAIPRDSRRFQVVCTDGADAVRAGAGPRPEVLLVDGFDPDGQAHELCSPDFYRDCHRRLASDGVMAVNLWGADPRAEIYRHRIEEAFSGRALCLEAEEDSNRVCFAWKDRTFPPAAAELDRAAVALAADHDPWMGAVLGRVLGQLEQARWLRRGAPDRS